MGKEKIATLPPEDLQAGVAKLSEEKIEWPKPIKKALVARRIADLMKDNDLTDGKFIQCLAPWSDAEFNPAIPCVSGLEDTRAGKISHFQNIMFKEVLVPKLMLGQSSSKLVTKFCQACLAEFSTVDFVELDDLSAPALSEATDIWNALCALINPRLPASEYKATGASCRLPS